MRTIESAHLRDYLNVLRKWNKVFLGTLGGIFLLILAYTFLATPLYEGNTKVIIEKVSPDNLTERGREISEDPEIFYETQYQLITSRAVAYRVIDSLSLENTYESFSRGRYGWVGDLLGLAVAPVRWAKELFASGDSQDSAEAAVNARKDEIANDLIKNLSVAPVKGSRISAISFLSPNPEFSALVANTYAKAYIQESLNMKLEATRRNLEWMTDKAEKERRKLDDAERKLQKYMRDNDLVTLENQVAIIPKQLSQLGEDLVRAEARRKELGLLYSKVSAVSGDLDAAETLISISEGATLDVLRAQILKAEQTVMELSSKYGNKHPTMLKAAADLEILKEKHRQEIQRIIQKIKDQYELALSVEQSLRSQFDRTKTGAINVNEQYTQYDILNRELETNRKLYETLLAKIKDKSITGETHPVNLWIVEEAGVPKAPKKPRKLLNVLFGLVFGTLCGVGAALFCEYFDNTIKHPIDAESILGIPLLGVVSTHAEAGVGHEQIALKDPKSISAECYRSLRTSLSLSSADAPPKRILITSPRIGEGKTTTATNLALSLVQAGARVLLIDADLRKPRIHKIFGLHSKNGLSTYLAGKVSEPELKRTEIENLAILPAGPIPPNPSELLSSARLKTMLDRLAGHFDVIICDSPPVLPVTDTRILCGLFDATIMVVRGGKTTYATGSLGVKSLKEANAKIIGMVINALDIKKHAEYYSDYYDYEPKAVKT